MSVRKKNIATRDEERARYYEKKDPRIAELYRIPREQRTADQQLALAVLLTALERAEGTYIPTVFAP